MILDVLNQALASLDTLAPDYPSNADGKCPFDEGGHAYSACAALREAIAEYTRALGDKVVAFQQDIELVEASADTGATIKAAVNATERGIEISFAGYGTAAMVDDAPPVFIELNNGVPTVFVWADINLEDPTHRISLVGALRKHGDS